MKRRYKNYMISYPIAAELVQQGIMFLPSKLKKMNLKLEFIKEPISFYGLHKFFQEKRLKGVDTNKKEEIQNSFLKDPILDLCYNDLIQLNGGDGTGYHWQDCLTRFYMLSLRPIYEIRNSIAEAKIMEEFVKKDVTLQFYTFEGIYVVDKSVSNIEFIDYLLESDNTCIYIPDKFVGNDITITITKLTLSECKDICQKLKIKFDTYKDLIEKLPLKRIITIQTKFNTTSVAYSKNKEAYALQTCLIENSYLGKKNNDSNNRKLFEGYLEKLTEIIKWNVGVFCIAGTIQNDFIQKIVKKDTNNLFGIITPLNFDFQGDLQNFLMDCCRLGDKKLKRKIDDLFDIKSFDDIMNMENLESLEYDKLKEIVKYFGLDLKIIDEGYMKKKVYVEKLKDAYKKKIKNFTIEEVVIKKSF
jgi:hypothetical protein